MFLVRLLIYREEQTWRGHPLAGRAALHLVFKRFKLERGAAMAFDIPTLTQLECGGDLEGFLSAWDYAFMALSKTPDEDRVHSLLEQQRRKARVLAPDFVLYDASPEGHPDRTSVFLYSAARAEVVRRQREATRQGLLKMAAAKAAPSVAKSKGEGKDDNGKGKGNDKIMPCHIFAKHGTCKFGSACKYAHISPEKLAAAAKPEPKPEAKPKPKAACKVFAVGNCKFGAKCRFSHAAAPKAKAMAARVLTQGRGFDYWRSEGVAKASVQPAGGS